MPNLMPDWQDWIRPAGRLLWATFLSGVSFAFITALILPPFAKRPVPTKKAIVGFPIILIGGLVLAKLINEIQTVWIWLTIFALIGYALLLVVTREPRDPAKKATWVECYLGAVGVFAVMMLTYAVLPHEWLTFANSYLDWGNSADFLVKSGDHLIFGLNAPFDINFPAIRDIVVTMIYVIFLGANVFLWSKWQKRHQVKERPAGEAVTRRSRFGRPLRRVETPAPEPAGVGASGREG